MPILIILSLFWIQVWTVTDDVIKTTTFFQICYRHSIIKTNSKSNNVYMHYTGALRCLSLSRCPHFHISSSMLSSFYVELINLTWHPKWAVPTTHICMGQGRTNFPCLLMLQCTRSNRTTLYLPNLAWWLIMGGIFSRGEAKALTHHSGTVMSQITAAELTITAIS